MSELSAPLIALGSTGHQRVREPDAIVASVEPGSIAEQLGLEPGDRLARIDGQPPRDIIDYQLWTAVEQLELTIERSGGEIVDLVFDKDEHEDLGLGFADELFVPLRTCNNGCLFCFVLQAPPGMRPTVYVKDDDYRLSFLHGHFTTLTNLTEPHFERIVAQRLSPLHVSVHASDPALRRELLANPKADVGWHYLTRLIAEGIDCHTQIVVCPGVNDGAQLDRTIADLVDLGPRMASIGVVPVGLTKYQEHPLMRPMTAAEAAATIDQIDAWRARRREIYAADELYLNAGRPFPELAYYDEFVQYENGIGPVPWLLDEVATLALPAAAPPCRVIVVTGEYGGRFLGKMIDKLTAVDGLEVELVPVVNELFGGNVACAGLLCGCDLEAELRRRAPADLVVVPARALNDEERFLDDVHLDELAVRLGTRIEPAATAADLASLACGVAVSVENE